MANELRDRRELVGDVFGQGEPNRARQPLTDQPVQQLVGAAGSIG
jgi:hypothetical protein